MTKKRVTVVARIKAKPDRVELVRKELLALVAPTTREQGCISYDLHQGAEDKTLFLFYENWLSREDLDEHLGTPHLQALLAKAEDLFAEPVDLSLWDLID